MPPPDSAQPPFHRKTQLPLPSSGAADGAPEPAEVAGHVERAERQREADEEEADEAEAEDGEVRADDVGGVLGPAEAGLDEGEPRLHEDDQDRADHHPQHVDLPAEGGHRIDVGLRWGEAEQKTVHELPPHDSWSPGRSGASVRTYESCVST